jgi:hypothetical protein
MNAPVERSAPPRRRGRRLAKILGFVAAGLVGLALVLYFAAGTILRKGVEVTGGKLLGVPVHVSSARVRLAGGVQMHGMSVGNPDGFEDPEAFHCEGLAVLTPVTGLLGNPVNVQEFVIQRPEVTLEIAEKKTNWKVLLDRMKAAAEDAKTKKKDPAPKATSFVIQRIRIVEPRLRFRSRLIAPEGVVLEFNDIQLDRVGNAPGTASTPSLVVAAVMQALFGGKSDDSGLPGPLRSSIRGELKQAGKAFGELLEATP